MSFKAPFLTFAEFPLVGNTTGDCRASLDDGKIYRWNGASWDDQNSLINNLYFQIPTSDTASNSDGGQANTNYGSSIVVDGGNA